MTNPFDSREAAFAPPPPPPEPEPAEPLTQDQAFRRMHIGAAEAATLVGLGLYDSPWSLYMKKIGKLAEPDFDSNERVKWGNRMEAVIVAEVGDRLGMDIRKWNRPPLSNGVLGGHPDARRVVSNKTRGIIETKTVDWMIYKGWGEQPPDQHVIQLNTYMGLAGVEEGWMAVLIGGNDLKIFHYEFRPRLFQICHDKAVEMLERIKRRDPPPVNYEVDADAINEIFRARGGRSRGDLTGDNELTDAILTYVEQSAIEKAAKDKKKAASAEIKHKAGDYDEIQVGDWLVKFSTSEETPDRLITAANCREFIGTEIKGRKASRSINPPKFIGRK